MLWLTSALPDWRTILLHFAFLQDFSQAHTFVLNGVYWTLPTAFGYYLLPPVFTAFAAMFVQHSWCAAA